jgi:hypothetical protein
MLRIIIASISISVICGGLFHAYSGHWNVPLRAVRAHLNSQWDQGNVQRQHTILIPEVD